MLVKTLRDLGNAVRAARLRQDLTQQELASRAGLSRQWLTGLERGTANPTWDVVMRLAAALDLEVSLYDRSKRDAPSPGDEERGAVNLDEILEAHRDSGRAQAGTSRRRRR